jgi:hypothetical protein
MGKGGTGGRDQGFKCSKNSRVKPLLTAIPRCTQVKNPEDGVAQIFTKIPGGVKAFRTKLPGGPLFWELLHFH